MTCYKCGASLPDNTPSVCPRCGAYNVPSGSRVLPSASQCVVSVGSSPLMLTAAIIYTLNVILGFISSLSSSYMDSLRSLYQMASILGVESEIYDLLDFSSSTMLVSAIISSIPALIFVIAVWLIYAGASGQCLSSKLTTGLKMIGVMVTIYLVLIAGVFIVLDIILLSLMASADSHAEVFLIPLIILNGVFAAIVFYYRGIKKTVDAASYSYYANVPSGGSVYVAVVNFILAGFSLLSLFGSMTSGNLGAAQILNMLLTPALFLIFGILILICRSRMSAVLYSSSAQYSNQPVYGTPYQPQPPQYQYPQYPQYPQQPQQYPQYPQQPQGQPSDATAAPAEAPSSEHTAAPDTPPTAEDDSWTCSCGRVNSGKFCSECGNKRPDAEWTCSCGHVNKGKFCTECGEKRPE